MSRVTSRVDVKALRRLADSNYLVMLTRDIVLLQEAADELIALREAVLGLERRLHLMQTTKPAPPTFAADDDRSEVYRGP